MPEKENNYIMINTRRNVQMTGNYNQPTLLSRPNSNQLIRPGQRMDPNLKVQGGFLPAQYERREKIKPVESPLRSRAALMRNRNRSTAGNIASTKGNLYNLAQPTRKYDRGMGKTLNRRGSIGAR